MIGISRIFLTTDKNVVCFVLEQVIQAIHATGITHVSGSGKGEDYG